MNNYYLIGLIVILQSFQYVISKVPDFSSEDLERLRGLTCTNLDEVAASVDFSNPLVDPFPKLWYDTIIDYNTNCYVIFKSATDYSEYKLKSWTASEYETNKNDATFLTHHGPCGVCSTMDDLNVYLAKPDLTTPVRRCALRWIRGVVMNCLKGLGFSDKCSKIWYWNTWNTGKLSMNGGCFGVCLTHIWTPNNQPEGTYNPCEPTEEIKRRSQDRAELENTAELTTPILDDAVADHGHPLCLGCWSTCKNPFSAPERKEKAGRCGNTINGRAACVNEQWQNGPYRMNSCLQCDECRSGPRFQKIAGRTRRATGIYSCIGRPGIPDLNHEYITNGVLANMQASRTATSEAAADNQV